MHGTIKTPATEVRQYVVKMPYGFVTTTVEPLITNDNRYDLGAIMRRAHASYAGQKARVASGLQRTADKFAWCLAKAWSMAKLEREARFPTPAVFANEFALERYVADCRYGLRNEASRIATHADIDRREAAARAFANAH
jgi:hypothetical protein